VTRKFIAIIFLIFIALSFAFALPKVNVKVSSTMATVTTRLYEYGVDLQSGILTNGYNVFYQDLHVWANSGDGLVLYYDGKALTPTRWSFDKSENKEFETTSNVTINFFYDVNGQSVEKSITFVNNPYYEIQVNVKAPKDLQLGLTFPTLQSNFNRTANEKMFGSFYTQKGIITLSSISNGTFNDSGESTFTGTLTGKIYMGPVKNTLIFSVFPKEQGVILHFIGTYPGSEPWYSWFLYIFVEFLNWLYNLTGNYGWAIILFGVIIRIILYPLSHVQIKSMLKMREIQPKIEALKNKYKDPKKLQEEQMKLMKAEGVSTASSCLPLLIQFPVLALLYYVIFYSREVFAYNPQFLIWKDLSIGGIGPNILLIFMIVILTAWSSLWTSTKPSQVWLAAGMSGVMEFLFVGFPVGLFLYYTTFSGMQVATNYIVARIYHMKGVTWREVFGMNPKVQWGDNKKWKNNSNQKISKKQ
jgi:YidC/Oxa1 family membrane protein insertase